jgi:tetratricopeptide (TPR) repeat protein
MTENMPQNELSKRRIGIAIIAIAIPLSLILAVLIYWISNSIITSNPAPIDNKAKTKHKSSQDDSRAAWGKLGDRFGWSKEEKRKASLFGAKLMFDKGETSFNANNYKEALESFKSAIYYNPEYAKAYFMLGVTYSRLRLYNEAIEAFDKCKSLKLTEPGINYALGLANFSIGNKNKGIALLMEEIKLNPKFIKPYNDIGIMYIKTNKFNEAIMISQLGLKQNSSNSDKYNLYANMGAAFNKMGKYNESINAYNNAISYRPEDGDGYALLANVYINKRQSQKAVDILKKAISLDQKSTASQYWLGIAYVDLGKINLAREQYEKISKSDSIIASDYGKSLLNAINKREGKRIK